MIANQIGPRHLDLPRKNSRCLRRAHNPRHVPHGRRRRRACRDGRARPSAVHAPWFVQASLERTRRLAQGALSFGIYPQMWSLPAIPVAVPDRRYYTDQSPVAVSGRDVGYGDRGTLPLSVFAATASAIVPPVFFDALGAAILRLRFLFDDKDRDGQGRGNNDRRQVVFHFCAFVFLFKDRQPPNSSA